MIKLWWRQSIKNSEKFYLTNEEKDLQIDADISSTSIPKLGANEDVITKIL